jgi:hypothetical protein
MLNFNTRNMQIWEVCVLCDPGESNTLWAYFFPTTVIVCWWSSSYCKVWISRWNWCEWDVNHWKKPFNCKHLRNSECQVDWRFQCAPSFYTKWYDLQILHSIQSSKVHYGLQWAPASLTIWWYLCAKNCWEVNCFNWKWINSLHI